MLIAFGVVAQFALSVSFWWEEPGEKPSEYTREPIKLCLHEFFKRRKFPNSTLVSPYPQPTSTYSDTLNSEGECTVVPEMIQYYTGFEHLQFRNSMTWNLDK
jgi:hypothetical protein